MKFIITSKIDRDGDIMYELFKYNLRYKMGAGTRIAMDWSKYHVAADDCINELKKAAINYVKNKQITDVIFEVEE